MADFSLHPQLAADTIFVNKLELSHVLLMNDNTYPWVVLVPEREGLREIHDLSDEDSKQLTREYRHVSHAMQRLFGADKMNIAALGNMVPQLHIHVIARFKNDPAWPGPIWGVKPTKPYSSNGLDERIALLKSALV